MHPRPLGQLRDGAQTQRDERRRPDHVIEPLERGEAGLDLGQGSGGIVDEQSRLRPDRRHVGRVVGVQGGLIDLGPAPGGLGRVAPDGREPRGGDGQVDRPAPDRIERQAAAHRLGRLVQPSEAGEGVAGERGEVLAEPALHAGVAGDSQPGARLLERRLELIRGGEVQREVVMADHEHVHATGRRREAACLPQLLDPVLGLAERHEVRAEDVAGPALLDGGTGGDRARDRRLGHDAARRPSALAHERARQPAEDLRPLSARRLGRHERHGQLVRGERRLALPEAPLEIPDRGVEHARS